MRVEEVTPSARCVTCGKKIEGEDYDEVWRKYTDHVTATKERGGHGKPATVTEANRP